MIDGVQHVGDEPGADALDLVRAGPERLLVPQLADHRRVDRLDRDDLDRRLAALEHLAAAGDRAAGADAADQDVDLAVGVAPDLLGGRPAVDLRVGRVLELLRHERVAACS